MYSLELAMHTVHENALRQNLKHNQLFCKPTTTPKLQVARVAIQISTPLQIALSPTHFHGASFST